MHRRRAGQQPFFFGVPVEAGDRAQPPSHRSPRPAPLLEVPGETLDVSPAHLEQPQVVLIAPHHELTQIERVGVAGQSAVASQETGQRQTFRIGEDRIQHHDSG